jgi:hypothetical protein
MTSIYAASAWRALRGFLTRAPRKCAVIAVTILALITGFVLIFAPATTAEPMSSNNHTTLFSGFGPNCPGDKPGMCPD